MWRTRGQDRFGGVFIEKFDRFGVEEVPRTRGRDTEILTLPEPDGLVARKLSRRDNFRAPNRLQFAEMPGFGDVFIEKFSRYGMAEVLRPCGRDKARLGEARFKT